MEWFKNTQVYLFHITRNPEEATPELGVLLRNVLIDLFLSFCLNPVVFPHLASRWQMYLRTSDMNFIGKSCPFIHRDLNLWLSLTEGS